jgi:hypothetical protein
MKKVHDAPMRSLYADEDVDDLMAKKTDQIDDGAFATVLKKYAAIWDVKCSLYKNKNVKARCWIDLIDDLQSKCF